MPPVLTWLLSPVLLSSLALAGLLLTPRPMWAQEVRGVVLEVGSARPIEGAYVSLVDGSGQAASSTLTSGTGAFVLRPFAAGRYRLRVERIGYETWSSEPLEVGAGGTVTRRLEVPVRAVNLAGLEVEIKSRCGPRGQGGVELLRVWEEARKALEVARWTESQGLIEYDLRTWERELDYTTLKIDREKARRTQRPGRSAFLSRPAQELADSGYVRRGEDDLYTYYAPDAAVLLSSVFQRDHCFLLALGEGDREGQIGIQFGPAERGRVVDVDGVLWVDAATAELRELNVQYSDLDLAGLPRGTGGGARVVFRRLPTGPWFVRRWWIRMPLLKEHRVRLRREVRPYAFKEAGGEVVGLRVPGGESLTLAEWGSVVGRVEDGVRGGPLAGAQVHLVGTERLTRTDEAGYFRLEFVPPGRYAVEVRYPHPLLSAISGPQRPVEVGADQPTSVELSYGAEWVMAHLCPEGSKEKAAGSGALLGEVRDAETGTPVPNAVVWISEVAAPSADSAESGMEGFQTDSLGTFLLCELPSSRVEVQASAPGRLSDVVRVEIPKGRLALRRLEISAVKKTAVAGHGEETVPRGAVLSGIVRSAETGDPVTGATVRLLEREKVVVTEEGGAFEFRDLVPGRYRLVTERLGLASDTVEVEVFGVERELTAAFTLETLPVELPRLAVDVQRTFRNPRLAGFYDRMQKGIGEFITKQDLAARDVVSNLRRIANVRVQECVTPTPSSARLRVGNCWNIQLARGTTGGFGGFDQCKPVVYLDGHLLTFFGSEDPYDLNPFTLVQRYPRDLLEGIEVYRSAAMAPALYRTIGDACGIILVWTRGRGSR
ncbi:MAG: carboxypeptidase regulatory-like domain-containing protein [Gemmatimonadota bacterium]